MCRRSLRSQGLEASLSCGKAPDGKALLPSCKMGLMRGEVAVTGATGLVLPSWVGLQGLGWGLSLGTQRW